MISSSWIIYLCCFQSPYSDGQTALGTDVIWFQRSEVMKSAGTILNDTCRSADYVAVGFDCGADTKITRQHQFSMNVHQLEFKVYCRRTRKPPMRHEFRYIRSPAH
jgi:hypothetical protein